LIDLQAERSSSARVLPALEHTYGEKNFVITEDIAITVEKIYSRQFSLETQTLSGLHIVSFTPSAVSHNKEHSIIMYARVTSSHGKSREHSKMFIDFLHYYTHLYIAISVVFL